MQFTFKRDEEGRERIWIGDVCVAQNAGSRPAWEFVFIADGVDRKALDDAIECADEAGFWEACNACLGYDCGRRYDVVTVDVLVAETSTTLVVVSEDDE